VTAWLDQITSGCISIRASVDQYSFTSWIFIGVPIFAELVVTDICLGRYLRVLLFRTMEGTRRAYLVTI